MMTEVNNEQPENALLPILITPGSMVIEVNSVLANKPSGILAPIVTENPVQPKNVYLLILVTLDGMVMEIPEQPENA